jgi:hypothetical protein
MTAPDAQSRAGATWRLAGIGLLAIGVAAERIARAGEWGTQWQPQR